MTSLVRRWLVDSVGIDLDAGSSLEDAFQDGELLVAVLGRLGLPIRPPIGPGTTVKRRAGRRRAHPEQVAQTFSRVGDALDAIGVVAPPSMLRRVAAGCRDDATLLLHAIKVNWERAQVPNIARPPTNALLHTNPVHAPRRRRRRRDDDDAHLVEIMRRSLPDRLPPVVVPLAVEGDVDVGADEMERRGAFRLARLAELDERIREEDYAAEFQARQHDHYRRRDDLDRSADVAAAKKCVERAEQQRRRRWRQEQEHVVDDLGAFERTLQMRTKASDIVDPAGEIRERRERQAIENERRMKRVEKIVNDRDQEAAQDEDEGRWRALEQIMSRPSIGEIAIDAALSDVELVARRAGRHRQWHDRELQRLDRRSAAVALRRDLAHASINAKLYERRLAAAHRRIAEFAEVADRHRRRNVAANCRRLLVDLVDSAVEIVDYKRMLRRDDVDPIVLDDWREARRYRQVAGDRLSHDERSVVDLERHMDRAALLSYLHGSSPRWSHSSTSTTELEPELGAVALGAALDDVVRRAIAPPIAAPIFTVPTIVAVVGKPFSGKTTVAKAIADSLGYVVVDVDAIAGAAADPPTDDEVIGLIEGVIDDASPLLGVVLDGFPCTFSQAAMLARRWSGFDLDRIVVPSSPGDSDHVVGRDRPSDLIPYPTGVPSLPEPPFRNMGGITVVVHLVAADDAVLRRRWRRRLDPNTGDEYSMETALPFDVVVKEGLVPPPSHDYEDETLPEMISAWSREWERLGAFEQLFESLVSVDAGPDSPDVVVAEALKVVYERLSSRSSSSPPSPSPTTRMTMPDPGDIADDFLDDDVARRIYRHWIAMEPVFVDHVKRVLRHERRSCPAAAAFFATTLDRFVAFIKRHDERQSCVDNAIADFNSIEFAIRTEDVVKAELHERCQTLLEAMRSLLDQKHVANLAEFRSIGQGHWLQKEAVACLERCLSLVQAEVSRHQIALAAFTDLDHCRGARPPPDASVVGDRVAPIQVAVSSPPPHPKKGSSVTAAATSLLDESSFVDAAGRFTIVAAADVLDVAATRAIDLAGDDKPSSNLARQENILTRNRLRRLLEFGRRRLRAVGDDANRLMIELGGELERRQRAEIACSEAIVHSFRLHVEEERPIVMPIKIVDGVVAVVDASRPVYDVDGDVIASLWDQPDPSAVLRSI